MILSDPVLQARLSSTETEAIRAAFEDLQVATPMGDITFRSIDNQSTAGAWVGTTTVKDGKGVMVNWVYKNGADYLPSDDVVKSLRPAD